MILDFQMCLTFECLSLTTEKCKNNQVIKGIGSGSKTLFYKLLAVRL